MPQDGPPRLFQKWELIVIACVPLLAALTLLFQFYFAMAFLAAITFVPFTVLLFVTVYIADQVRWRMQVRDRFKRS